MTAYSESYDDVFYTGFAYRESRPDRLELIGRLFGLDPRPAGDARVLEIGCATGANILPMAEHLPRSRFVGIDLSGAQVDVARELAAAAGIDNVELLKMDLCDVDERMGTFDYVIAHGIYSWVPAPVREKLLEMCSRVLAPHGLAFISHNVKPGWHARAMAREIMLFHTRSITDPKARAAQARSALDFVLRGARPQDEVFRATLAEQLKSAANAPDWVLLHDHLAENNEAWYFHEVCARLAAHGLQYLADGDLSTMGGAGLPEDAVARLDKFNLDAVLREQYLDILKNRKFRMTVACRGELAIDRKPSASRLARLHVVSPADLADGDLKSSAPATFATANTRIRLEAPLVKQMLGRLIDRWPGSMPFRELAGTLPGMPAEALASTLLRLLEWEMVELACEPERGVSAAGERPRASRLARLCSQRGFPVANLRHERALLDESQARLLVAVDGETDRAALAARFGDGLEKGLAALVRKALLLA